MTGLHIFGVALHAGMFADAMRLLPLLTTEERAALDRYYTPEADR